MVDDPDAPPATIAINAWTGEPADSEGSLAPETKRWATKPAPGAMQMLKWHRPDPRNWCHPEVGWGLVMEHRANRSAADNATLKDMPEPIRELVAFRKGVVLGWNKANGTDSLIRYLPDNTTRKVPISDIERGTAPGALPRYILILGGPDKIPWRVHYTLSLCAAVGRLDLDEDGLKNYVAAVLANWPDPLDVSKCVQWSVDQGGTDITALMKNTVAVPLFDMLKADDQIAANARFITDAEATQARLVEALTTAKPSLVVTTSHGKTGPLADPAAMRRDLGLMVDRAGATLPLADLLAGWQPNGAIWYAQACCSAGCDTGSVFAGLFKPTDGLALLLEAIGRLGAQSAPLPSALLGAKKPLRAFIGHVEPTFDWTLTTPDMKQNLTSSITTALYKNLFEEHPVPIGMAFSSYFMQVGNLFNQWDNARTGVRTLQPGAERKALRSQLGALDRRSLVILGDPAVALPALS